MIQAIREQLELTQEDLSIYLGLSPHMIKSVEIGRRQLSMDSLAALAALYQAMKDGQTRGAVSDPSDPAPATNEQIRLLKRLHRKCSRRLRKYTSQLEKMQKSYATASARLGVYQFLAQSLTPVRNADENARLKWVEWKIEETMQCIGNNNVTAQEILTLAIASLRHRVEGLEGSSLFPFRDAR